MEHIREALVLFARHRRLWSYVAVPLAWSAGAYLVFGIVGYFLFMPLFRMLLGGIGLERFADVGVAFYVVLWILVSGIVFIGIASFFSSLLWDKLSAEVELLTTGGSASHPVAKATVIADSFKRMLFTMLLALVAMLAGLCLPVVAPLLVAAYAGLLDFTAPAFMRRGHLLGSQRRLVGKLKGRWTFSGVAGLVTLAPFVNVLLMPIMVAAGTIMVARSSIETGSSK